MIQLVPTFRLTSRTSTSVTPALHCTLSIAGSYMLYARAMCDRLPKVGAVFEAGDIDYRTFQTIVYRTELIEDEQKMAVTDRRVKV